jgi:hypothetical protein
MQAFWCSLLESLKDKSSCDVKLEICWTTVGVNQWLRVLQACGELTTVMQNNHKRDRVIVAIVMSVDARLDVCLMR